MENENSVTLIQNRKIVARLINNVILGKMHVSMALKQFPKNCEDKSINVALYALTHLEADEEIRQKNRMYAREQDDYLVYLMETLSEGYSLPQNIIAEYEEYYNESPIYPIMTKENIIKRLKKFINM